ncbi:MAG: DUF4097 family beta strand repeat protein, partial [Candidatus Eremiobacteraeota bacterium]|nr:DUF4097 family beta strand repeat protein [Candidatus Eremiobacteraeota bacterium]
RVASSDGRILLQQIVAARLDATSSDGHVEASALNVRDGSIESDGHVTLGFASGADTMVNAETSDGKVNVSGFTAASPFEPQRSSDDDNDSASQTVRVGAGEGHLSVHANDGNINLTQEG